MFYRIIFDNTVAEVLKNAGFKNNSDKFRVWPAGLSRDFIAQGKRLGLSAKSAALTGIAGYFSDSGAASRTDCISILKSAVNYSLKDDEVSEEIVTILRSAINQHHGSSRSEKEKDRVNEFTKIPEKSSNNSKTSSARASTQKEKASEKKESWLNILFGLGILVLIFSFFSKDENKSKSAESKIQIQIFTEPSGVYTVGDTINHKVQSLNVSSVKFSALDLPDGLKINKWSGLISGKAEKQGNFEVTVIAEKGDLVRGEKVIFFTIKNKIYNPKIESRVTSSTVPSNVSSRVAKPTVIPRLIVPSVVNAYLNEYIEIYLKTEGVDSPKFIFEPNLPAGLSIDSRGKISGYPLELKSKTISVIVKGKTNSNLFLEKKIEIKVHPPRPIVLEEINLRGEAWELFEEQIYFGESIISQIKFDRLPKGLEFDFVKKIIRGIPFYSGDDYTSFKFTSGEEGSQKYFLKVNYHITGLKMDAEIFSLKQSEITLKIVNLFQKRIQEGMTINISDNFERHICFAKVKDTNEFGLTATFIGKPKIDLIQNSKVKITSCRDQMSNSVK